MRTTFTGIIEEVGTVVAMKRLANSACIELQAKKILQGVKVGDSIAVNGICLTVTALKGDSFTADIMHETMRRSSIRNCSVGSRLNLERAMRADGRFDGHIVAGHIDGVGTIEKVWRDEIAVWYRILTDDKINRFMMEKGSVAVDGISLTVASVQEHTFCVSVIPHTAEHTTLSQKKAGDMVNLENDCIGKYVAHFLQQDKNPALTKDFLRKYGF